MQKGDKGFQIIYDDEDICVVEKAAGLLAVPIPNSTVYNLLDALRDFYRHHNKTDIKSVHRIDRYTSGLMVFSKHKEAYRSLFNQFKNHKPERCYRAIVRGCIEQEEGTLTHHLKRIKEGFRNIVAAEDEPGAAPARLHFKVLERFSDTTYTEIWLDTGLKNQIRVQFQAIGHPLVGDQHYAPEEEAEPLINRQALHAYRLGFLHPLSQKRLTFTSPAAADMLRLVEHYRWQQQLHENSLS